MSPFATEWLLTLEKVFSIIVATCLKKRESEREKNLARPFEDKEVELTPRGLIGALRRGY